MFEAAELGRKISKAEYKEQEPELRLNLIQTQVELSKADFPVIVIIAGNDRPGRNEVLNHIHEWMDPRFLQTQAFAKPTAEELERPSFWRYWQALPPDGRIGIFVRDWTSQIITERLNGEVDDTEQERRVRHIRSFEKMLVDDGALVLKIWLHLSRDELKKRMKAAKKDPDKAWKFHKRDQVIYENYDQGRKVVEEIFRRTSTGEAPWHIIESTNSHYRNLTVGKILFDTISKRLKGQKSESAVSQGPVEVLSENPITILDKVDLTLALEKDKYEKDLKSWQAKLNRLTYKAHGKGISSVMLFEGWDAAGKGGIIRRMTGAMDATTYRIIPIAAPNDEERAHHYLWRFWRHLPRAGNIVIFDRTWYGRVLVERVEGFATETEWRRAYSEINDFEEMLIDHGIVLLKFWLHINQEEQMNRFKRREETAFKKYKITKEDYRNREKWNDYELAVNEMIERTSTGYANWHIVSGNNKRWARIDVIKTVCKSLEKAL